MRLSALTEELLKLLETEGDRDVFTVRTTQPGFMGNHREEYREIEEVGFDLRMRRVVVRAGRQV